MKKKNNFKIGKVFFTICSMVLLFNVKTANAISISEVQSKLNSLMNQYVGTTWTRSYAGGSQCYAFAHYVFDTVFSRGEKQVGNGAVSSNSTCYKLNNVAGDITTIGTLTPGYSLSSLEQLLEKAMPGDYVQVKRRSSGGPHSMIVVSVNGSSNTIEIFDANTDGKGTVKRYSQSFSTFMDKNSGVSVYRYSGYSPSYNPEGVIDYAEGKTNAVWVRGWAFDKDDVSKAVAIHVYIGGPAGSGAPGYAITANKYRPDVNNAYSVGAYHGYEETIRTDRTGEQTVYFYAINVGGGNNVFLGSKTVTITKDVTPPTISNVTISEKTNSSYTVTCDVSDESGIAQVQFPSWYAETNTPKQIWYKGTVSNGKATCKIPITELGNVSGTYITHIYADDNCGNSSCKGISVEIDTTPVSDRNLANLGTDFYGYISAANGKVLSVESDDNVVCRTNTDADTQRWKFIRNSDGSYRIQSKANGKCLDNYGAHGTSNSNVAVYTSNTSDAQKWNIIQNEYGSYYLMPKCSSDCVLDLLDYNNAEGANIAIHTFNSTQAQRFSIVDDKPLSERSSENIGESFIASIENTGIEKVLTVESGNVVSKTDTGAGSQRWKFTRLADGSYRIQAKSDGTYLNNTEGTNNSNVNVSSSGSGNGQAWIIYEAGGGSYYLRPKSSDTCVLDLTNYSGSEGANIAVHTFNTSTAQRYKIKKEKVDVTGISIDLKKIEFTGKNETKTLKPTVLPADATNKNVVWSSSNTNVATVNGNGKVTSVGNGTATITATTEDGQKSVECLVTVKIPIKVEEITLNRSQIIMTEKGEKQKIQTFITPPDATNPTIVWKSSDTSVASVDTDGTVTAVKNGTTTITATTEDGNYMAACEVTVEIPIHVSEVQLNEKQIQFTGLGETKQLNATVGPENATNKAVLWSSDNEEVAFVDDDGVVTAAGEGTAVITVTSLDQKITDSCIVTVVLPIKVTGIKLNQSSITFTKIGERITLTPSISPENATNQKVSWSSNDTEVAIVSDDGEVTAVGEGKTVIIALTEDGHKSAVCSVVVQEENEEAHVHNFKQTSLKEPTCTDAGKASYLCEECGNTYTETLQALGHSKETVLKNTKEATCMEAGYTGDQCCKNCGSILKKGKKIEALDHVWDTPIVLKESTCMETGIKVVYCKRCVSEKREVIGLKEHSIITDEAIAPACETKGKTEGSHCSVCGSIIKAQTEVPAKGHNWGEEIKIKEPTCLEKGKVLYLCKTCNKTWTKDTTYGDHIYQAPVIRKQATEAEEGLKVYTCVLCKHEKTEVIPKLPKSETKPAENTTQSQTKPATVKAGQSVAVSSAKATFKVKTIGKSGYTVEYVKPKSKNYSFVSVPTSVKINGKVFKVVSIGNNAFKNNNKLTKVTIGSNVKTIGTNAFSGCSSLKIVSIGKNVTKIGSGAFYKCIRLTKVTIPSKISYIGKNAFYGCKYLKSIIIKTSKLKSKAVGKDAFKGIYKKATIKVPGKQLKAYQKLLKSRGIGKNVKITK